MGNFRFHDGHVAKHTAGFRRLWVFDFDGTLSPLVPDRSIATLDPACRKMLAELSAGPREIVAILSSRAIEDLVPRVPVPGVYLGGGSGLEWRLPGGLRLRPGREAERKAEKRREELFPLIETLRSIPGVEVEDKRWSMAVHTRRVPPMARGDLLPLLEALRGRTGLRVFTGPDATEVPFLASASKSFGLRTLCRHLKFDPSEGRMIYAGDDGNDAVAMRWVLARKGVALVVGDRIEVPGATILEDPPGLAAAVHRMANLPSRRQVKGRREAAAG